MEEKIFKSISDIPPVATAHNQGKKFVFLANEDTATKITQFAVGEFMPGEECEEHIHKTMEECFYFLSGEGIYTIDGVNYPLKEGVFLRIPAGKPHNLVAIGTEKLRFVYYGVATE
ncbi:cupin domain-containing protein [Foetidibacter luteolus]|uniref:cupin domain-containing protein n=1 Tax=Foetidibacter luteolus TaxID=2608880 RepID=UPI00129ABA54|nr:cupin domain-containing protein [Foetidibacter luteolus]